MDIRISIAGTAPILMHNVQLADPMNKVTRAINAINAKRKKTDDDHIERSRLEHLGSLYLDLDVGPYVPGQNIESCLVAAGKVTKSGVRVTRSLFVHTDVNPIAYTGPRDASGLWANENFRHMAAVKVGQSRVMRCRPMFRDWRTEALATLDTSVLSLEELQGIAETAGSMIGLGDYRPRYGRFIATVEPA